MNINLLPGQPCPCGSKVPVARCCFVNGRLVRPPARIIVPGPRTGFAHPKCYARGLDDCDQTISGEDYISFNILEQIGGPLTVSGLTWLPDGVEKEIPLKALRANVLCRRHNSALSPLDSTVGELFRQLVKLDELINSGSGERRIRLFNGYDLERWLLKVLCGVVAAGIADHTAGDQGIRDMTQWLSVLFENKRFPRRHGLYVHAEVGSARAAENTFSLALISSSLLGVYGMIMTLRDKVLILALDDPGQPVSEDSIIAHAMYRPQEFIATSAGVIKSTIYFTWLDRHTEQGIVWDYSQK